MSDSKKLTQDDIQAITDKMLFEMPLVPTDIAVLFGSGGMSAHVALKAAESYFKVGGYKQIIVSGGPTIESKPHKLALIPNEYPHLPGETEAEYMCRILIEKGVPPHIIHMDTKAQHTAENIENAMKLGLEKAFSATFFAPAYLQRRTLMTFRQIIPEYSAMPVCVQAAYPNGITKNNWDQIPLILEKMHDEAWKAGIIYTPAGAYEDGDTRNYIDRGFITEINLEQEIFKLSAAKAYAGPKGGTPI